MTIMKGNGFFAIALSAALLVSSCGSMSDGSVSGGFLGAELGSILGSAIGGISNGPRGSDVGTIVGMAGGAVLGAVVGDASDKAKQKEVERYDGDDNYRSCDNDRNCDRSDTYRGYDRNGNSSYDSQPYGNSDDSATSGFNPENGGDDIIQFDAPDGTTTMKEPDVSGKLKSEPAPYNAPALELRNVRFVSKSNNLTLHSSELAKVVVEVYNNTPEYMYNVKPMVVETSGNKHVFVSAPIIVEKIAPGKGIRYTAMVKADRKLKDGKAHFTVCAQESAQLRQSEIREFEVTTIR